MTTAGETPRHHRGDMWALWDTWGRHPGSVLAVTVNATQKSQYASRTAGPVGRPTGTGRKMELGEKYGVMGKGCAREARLRHPELQRWWSGKLSLGEYGGPWQPTPIDPDPPGAGLGRLVGLLVTKINWWDPSPGWLVESGLEALRLWADDPAQAGRERFVLPLPGAGCGGLDPDRVKRLCRTHLDGRFVVCTK